MFGGSNENSTTFKIFELMKLFRLLRLGRLISFLRFRQDIKIGVRFFWLVLMLLLVIHWVGCALQMVVQEEFSWIPPKDLDAGSYIFYEESWGS